MPWKEIPLEARLFSKIRICPDDCWLWTGAKKNTGYGMFTYTNYKKGLKNGGMAHRRVYEYLIGPVPKHLELDHLCRNRLCVNPLHLEPVTHQENSNRTIRKLKTVCKKGHALLANNLYVAPSGDRFCLICKRETNKQYMRRRACRISSQ